MKRALAVTVVVAAALGLWAGISEVRDAEFAFQAGLAILFGGNLLLCLWVGYRAQPGSGDAMVWPVLVLVSAAMLIGALPRLFWPTSEGLRIAGWISSLTLTAAALILQFRRRRSLRPGSRSV